MAIKPYGSQKIENQELPSARFAGGATSASFGGGQAAELQKTGSDIQDTSQTMAWVAKREQDALDTAMARDALVNAHQEASIYTEDYFQKKGKDALDGYEVARQKFTEMAKKHSKKLTREQKEKFDASFNSDVMSKLDGIYRHQKNQEKEFVKNTRDAENFNNTRDAVTFRYDPDVVAQKKNDIVLNVAANAKDNGASPEMIKAEVLKATNALHTEVVESLISDGSYGLAQKYISDNKTELDSTVLPELEAKIKKLGDESFVQSSILTIGNSGLSIEDQLKEAEKLAQNNERVDLADDLREGLIKYKKDMDDIKEAKEKEAYGGEVRKALTDPKYKIPTWINDPEKINFLNKVREDFRKYNKHMAGVSGISLPDSTALKNEILSKPANEFVSIDFWNPEYANQLNPADMKELMDLQSEVRSGKNDKYFRLMTISQQAEKAIAGFKDISDKNNKNAIVKANRFYQQFEQAVNMLPAEKRTYDEINKITKTLLSPVSVRGAKYRFELPYLGEKVSDEYLNKEFSAIYGDRVKKTDEGFFAVESKDKNTRIVLDHLGRKVKTQKRNNNANKQ